MSKDEVFRALTEVPIALYQFSVMEDSRQSVLEGRVGPTPVMVDFQAGWRDSIGARWANPLSSMLTQLNADPPWIGFFAENAVVHAVASILIARHGGLPGDS